MFYVGTVRSNRLKGVTLKTEKELKKEGRGTSDSQVEEREKLIVVRWYDNKSVDFLSSYVGEIKYADGTKLQNLMYK